MAQVFSKIMYKLQELEEEIRVRKLEVPQVLDNGDTGSTISS